MSAGSLSTFLSNRYGPQPFRATGRLPHVDDDQREALRPLRAADIIREPPVALQLRTLRRRGLLRPVRFWSR